MILRNTIAVFLSLALFAAALVFINDDRAEAQPPRGGYNKTSLAEMAQGARDQHDKEREFSRKMSAAIERLKTVSADGRTIRAEIVDVDKLAAQHEIESLLTEFFDQDMQARTAELEGIKQRVSDLEAHLKKRKAAKKEIIDLQLKTIVNEANGLGFFQGRASDQRDPGGAVLPYDATGLIGRDGHGLIGSPIGLIGPSTLGDAEPQSSERFQTAMRNLVAQLFSRGDTNGDGKLSPAELDKVKVTAMHPRDYPAASADLNGDGALDQAELLQWMLMSPTEKAKAKAAKKD